MTLVRFSKTKKFSANVGINIVRNSDKVTVVVIPLKKRRVVWGIVILKHSISLLTNVHPALYFGLKKCLATEWLMVEIAICINQRKYHYSIIHEHLNSSISSLSLKYICFQVSQQKVEHVHLLIGKKWFSLWFHPLNGTFPILNYARNSFFMCYKYIVCIVLYNILYVLYCIVMRSWVRSPALPKILNVD